MWRLRLDSNTGCLAVEVRDPDLLLARFYTINTLSGTVQQLALPEAKAWWQGLEDAGQGLVYLHGYGNRQLGQHKGIFAFSGTGAGKVWEVPKLAFYGMAQPGLLAYDPEQPEAPFQVLEPATGRATGELLSQQEAAEAAARYNQVRFRDCLYPMLYHEGTLYFNQVKAFLQEQLQVQPVQAVEYAETETCLVISYYLPQPDGKLDNVLAVFSLSGKLHQNVKIGSQLSAIGSDTFFIFKHNLYFILNKDTLQVFRLLA
ncbi:DUF4905 domain-containing protein [Pontibacter mangrovi]|uniref:DUF4905 domain-containing protein n=1 Tax=Pontibacter mangrovi TaxID=2589816 RepID=A0A501W0I7_9BACT|nr:DUF4905 domain-containing protein [Pontibacter mangrovi]TPE42125.1 DUF4905 domain-containing protein [Pontibacter mangrovi]